MYKIDIWVSFNCGAYALQFRKIIELPFTPFISLWIDDSNEDHENIIELKTTDYCTTMIMYNLKDNSFEVNVRNTWRPGISDETIDYTIEKFIGTNWERKDSTNIPDWKELNKRYH